MCGWRGWRGGPQTQHGASLQGVGRCKTEQDVNMNNSSVLDTRDEGCKVSSLNGIPAPDSSSFIISERLAGSASKASNTAQSCSAKGLNSSHGLLLVTRACDKLPQVLVQHQLPCRCTTVLRLLPSPVLLLLTITALLKEQQQRRCKLGQPLPDATMTVLRVLTWVQLCCSFWCGHVEDGLRLWGVWQLKAHIHK